jgi:hypothetical protein
MNGMDSIGQYDSQGVLIEIYTWMEDKASTYEHINEVM